MEPSSDGAFAFALILLLGIALALFALVEGYKEKRDGKVDKAKESFEFGLVILGVIFAFIASMWGMTKQPVLVVCLWVIVGLFSKFMKK